MHICKSLQGQSGPHCSVSKWRAESRHVGGCTGMGGESSLSLWGKGQEGPEPLLSP